MNLDAAGIACILGDLANNTLSILVTNRPYSEISTILNQNGIGRFVVISTPDLTISAQLLPGFTREVKTWHSPYFLTNGCIAEAIKIMTGCNEESIVQANQNVFHAMQAIGVRDGPTSLIPRVKEELAELNRYLTGPLNESRHTNATDRGSRAIVDAVEAMLEETVPVGVSIKELRDEAGKLPTIASKVSDISMSGVNRSAIVQAYVRSADSQPRCYRVSMDLGYVFMVDNNVVGATIIQDEEYDRAIPVRIG